MNKLNISLPESKTQSMQWDFPVKKKFHVQLSAKKVMLTIFWHMKKHIIIDFFEKGATVNRASFYLYVICSLNCSSASSQSFLFPPG